MTEADIRSRVHIIVEAYTKDVKIQETDLPTINAAIDLVVNFLHCVNVIADKKN